MSGMTPKIGRTGRWEQQLEDNAAQHALPGTIERAEGGPHGDWTLYYTDGRIVFINCGYVGATIEVWRDYQGEREVTEAEADGYSPEGESAK